MKTHLLVVLELLLVLLNSASRAADSQDPEEIKQERKNPTPSKWLFADELKWLSPDAAKKAASDFAHAQTIEGFDKRPEQVLPDKRLRCVIALAKERLVAGEQVVLKATIKNESKQPWLVNLGQPMLGFQARFIEDKGASYWGYITRIEGSFGQVHLDDFRRIPPGESISLNLPIMAIKDHAAPQSHSWPGAIPGKFIVTLSYSNGVDAYPDGSGLKVLPEAWVGTMISNGVVLLCE